MRTLLFLLSLLLAQTATAQSTPALADSVRAHLQVELREMARTDQRVRYMAQYGTFSPCVADSLRRVLSDLPTTEEYIERNTALRAEADARLSPAEKNVLLRAMQDADRAIVARLRDIIAEHGWPSDERTGADAHPVVFLLHAPHEIDAMAPMLLAEVRAGRMPARAFAIAIDKARKVRGELQLYGTAEEFDAQTQTVQPPIIDSVEATNAARREIGLAPLDAYRLAETE